MRALIYFVLIFIIAILGLNWLGTITVDSLYGVVIGGVIFATILHKTGVFE